MFIIYFPTLTLICLRNIISVHSVPNVFSLSFLNPMDGEAYSPWGHKGSDTTERLHFHFQCLEKDPALRAARCLLSECVAGDLVK